MSTNMVMLRALALSDSIESIPKLLRVESVMLFRRYVFIFFSAEKLLSQAALLTGIVTAI
jgi:hypothetical protein